MAEKRIKTKGAPSDPLYAAQWNLRALGDIEAIWADYTGAGVAIGLFDSGFQSDHPDLVGAYDPSLDLVTGGERYDPDLSSVPVPPLFEGYLNNHGTAVAGIMVAAQNDIGTVGIAHGATLGAAVSLGTIGDTYVPIADFDQYLTDLLAHMGDFDVTNNSWGFNRFSSAGDAVYGDSRTTAIGGTEISQGMAASAVTGRGGLGTVHVKGAGNDLQSANVDVFNSDRTFIVVSGFNVDGGASDGNRYGGPILVTAPSQGGASEPLWTTDEVGALGYNTADSPEGDYADFSGTSAASPHVAGVVALMLEANPGLGWRDVQKIIAYSARHVGSDYTSATPEGRETGVWAYNHATDWNNGAMTFHATYGFGAVDVHGAVRMAEAWSHFGAAQTSMNEAHVEGADLTSMGVAIPPNGVYTTIEYQIDAAAGFRIEHVAADIDITHPDFGDVSIYLESPNGTVSSLYGPGALDILVDLDVADSGFDWTYGSRNFYGEDPTGTWTLYIADSSPSPQAGLLDGLHLDIYGQQTDADDVYTYTDEVFDMLALDPSRARLHDTGGKDWMNLAAITGDVTLDLKNGWGNVDGEQFVWFTRKTWIEKVYAGDGGDQLRGTNGGNALFGARGDDTLVGRGGADRLHGGEGTDTLFGGQGDDTLFGGRGNDALGGGRGDDFLFGRTGNDTLLGRRGDDTLVDGVGHDLLRGGGGADIYAIGQDGQRDTVAGFSLGEDRLMFTGAGPGEVTLTALANNRLRIDHGDDVLIVTGHGVAALALFPDATDWIEFI